jgi:hypothetical protein
MPTVAGTIYSLNILETVYGYPAGRRQNVKLPASVTYAKGTVLGQIIGTNEVQTITLAGTGIGGTYKLTFNGATTGALPFNSTAAQVQVALQALSTIAGNNVTVTGTTPTTSGGVLTLTFINQLAYTNVPQTTADGTGLTGTSPTITAATTTSGAGSGPGAFTAYASGNTDGSQVPKGVLEYDSSTDSNGNIVTEWGGTLVYGSCYFGGYFATEELVGLDSNAVSAGGWHLVSGTVAGPGVLCIP